MVIFYSYVSLPEGNHPPTLPAAHLWPPAGSLGGFVFPDPSPPVASHEVRKFNGGSWHHTWGKCLEWEMVTDAVLNHSLWALQSRHQAVLPKKLWKKSGKIRPMIHHDPSPPASWRSPPIAAAPAPQPERTRAQDLHCAAALRRANARGHLVTGQSTRKPSGFPMVFPWKIIKS